MGNTAALAVRDITADGNEWRDDRISLPLTEDIFGFSLEQKHAPSLVVAPMASQGRSCVSTATADLSESEESTGDTELESVDAVDTPSQASPPGSLATRTPSEDAFEPNQVVLQPSSAKSPKQLGKWRAAEWRPLQQCGVLRGHVLLTPNRLSELHPHLPVGTRFATSWRLIYSPRVHGISLGTFYRQCQAWPGETLLLVEDTDGTTFGGFASHTWRASRQHLHSGRAECFVFTFGSDDLKKVEHVVDSGVQRLGFVCAGPVRHLEVSRVHLGSWAHEKGLVPGDWLSEVDGVAVENLLNEELESLMRTKRPLRLTFLRQDSLVVYPWAGGNQCFMFADDYGISMGSGKNLAFWVNKDFLKGTSGASETFGNPGPLASATEFVVRNFECWAFGHSVSALEEPVSEKALPITTGRKRTLWEQAASARRFQTLD